MINKDKWSYNEKENSNEQKRQQRSAFYGKYGTILSGMRKEKTTCLAYILIFVARRILMTFLVLIPSVSV